MSESGLDLELEVQRELGRKRGLKLGEGFDRDMLAWTVERYQGIERTQAYEHAYTASTLGALRERLAAFDEPLSSDTASGEGQ